MKLLLSILLVGIVFVSGCTSYGYGRQPQTTTVIQPSQSGNQQSVSIQGFAFNPNTITITRGTTVTWTNQDSAPHTVTSDTFDSGTLQKGQRWSYTFNDTGTFNYICSIHPNMKGTVVVTQ